MPRPDPPAPAHRPVVAVAAALVVAVVVLVGAAVVMAGADDPRLRTPDVVLDAAPGEVVAAVEVDPPGGGGRAWRIEYASRAPDGSVVPVSGLVVRPPGPAPEGGFPVVAWAHPTVGVADDCAPSTVPDGVPGVVEGLVGLDAVVVATDYPGLGTPGPHPYLVGESEGAAVLDAVRAARSLSGVDAAPTGGVGLVGYSQGGHAVLFARAMAPTYAPDVEVAGTVAVAPVTDVGDLVVAGRGNPDLVGLRLYVLRTWSQVYEGLEWSDVATPAADPLGATIDASCGSLAPAVAEVEFLESLWRADPLSRPRWRAAVEANTPSPAGTPSPLLVVHGEADPVVPIGGTRRFVADACHLGEPVELRVDPDWNHGSVFLETWDEGVAWLGARLAGEAAPGTCA